MIIRVFLEARTPDRLEAAHQRLFSHLGEPVCPALKSGLTSRGLVRIF